MTTSFTRTRNQLKTLVLGKLGVTSTTSADADLVYEAIDLRVKEMHRLGIFWRNVVATPVTFSLTAAVNSASATADILFPISLVVRDSSLDQAVQIIDVMRYNAIQDKTVSGTPTHAMWRGAAEFIFYPIPTANTVAKLVYEAYGDDTADATAPDVDVAMLRWLKDIVAYDVGDQFGVDEVRMQRFGKECAIAERNIRKLNALRVDPTTVAVDDFDGRMPNNAVGGGYINNDYVE